MPTQDELQSYLLLVHASQEGGWTDFLLPTKRVDEFCTNPAARAELVKLLRDMADRIEREFPSREYLLREVWRLTQRNAELEIARLRAEAAKGGTT